MQRVFIPVAVATALVTSAGAQAASVTLYGVVDAGIFGERVKIDGQRQNTAYGMRSGGQSGSRWGLRGSEDLGNGLKLNFRLESGFNSNNGASGQNGRLFGRAAWAGLSGNFGETRFGRQATVSSDFFSSISPFGSGWSNAGIGKGGFRASDTPRFDNSVAYISPKLAGGLQFAGSYSFNTRGNAETRDNSTSALSLATRYTSGPLYLALTYDRLRPSNTDPNARGRDPSAIQLGGSYDFKVARLYAGWSQQKNGWIKSAEGAPSSPNNNLGSFAYLDGKVNAYLIGAKVPFASSELLASFHYVDGSDAFVNSKKVKVYNLGYSYKLSKRTNLYAMISFHDGRLYGFTRDSDSQQFGIGIRHQF